MLKITDKSVLSVKENSFDKIQWSNTSMDVLHSHMLLFVVLQYTVKFKPWTVYIGLGQKGMQNTLKSVVE